MHEPEDGVVLGMEDMIRPPVRDGKLRCNRCHAELTAPVIRRGDRQVIPCSSCGHEVRVSKVPRPVQPRQGGRTSKKERMRLRRELQRNAAVKAAESGR